MTRRTRALAGAVGLALVVLLAVVLARSHLVGPGSATTRAPNATTASQATSTPSGRARDPESGLPFVELTALPVEARRTVQRIESGGPFPYPKDGVTFGNRERLLPAHRTGYYREYTVATPGSSDRGGRRIVTGDGDRQLFYTADHYLTFARIRR